MADLQSAALATWLRRLMFLRLVGRRKSKIPLPTALYVTGSVFKGQVDWAICRIQVVNSDLHLKTVQPMVAGNFQQRFDSSPVSMSTCFSTAIDR